MKPGVEWDLYQIHQKKGEFLREFIRRFIKKRNSIPSVSNAVVMVAFQKGVKDPDLLKKMSRKQPRTVKELFDMADRYANQEDAMVEWHPGIHCPGRRFEYPRVRSFNED